MIRNSPIKKKILMKPTLVHKKRFLKTFENKLLTPVTPTMPKSNPFHLKVMCRFGNIQGCCLRMILKKREDEDKIGYFQQQQIIVPDNYLPWGVLVQVGKDKSESLGQSNFLLRVKVYYNWYKPVLLVYFTHNIFSRNKSLHKISFITYTYKKHHTKCTNYLFL